MRGQRLGAGLIRSDHAFYAAAALIALSGAALEARRLPSVATVNGVFLSDPDDYMRLHRARQMLETGTPRIRLMSDINHPHGAELHWTAPLDWLLVGAMAIFAPLVAQPDPFAYVAAWAPVIVGAGYTLLMVSFVRRLGGRATGLIAGILVVLSPGFHRAFQLGHPDHHFLLEFLFLLSISLWATGRAGSSAIPSPRTCAISGAAMGLAIWIAPQALAVWVCILAGATLATFHASPEDRPAWRGARLAWSLSVLAVACIGWFLENWPEVGRVAADKISLWTVVILAAALWIPDGTNTGAERRRAIRAFGITVTCVGLWMWLDRQRIFEHLNRPEFARWSALVMELQPLASGVGRAWSPRGLHEFLGYFAYALPILLLGLYRSKSQTCQMKATLGLLAIGFVGASILQRRWLDHVNLGLIPVAVLGAQEWCRAFASRRAHPEPALAGLVLLVLAAIFQPAIAGVIASLPIRPSPHQLRTVAAARSIRQDHERHATPTAPPPAILCEDGDGPMLLYLTQQPIVAAPYHRTLDGLLEAARFFCERDPVAARKRLDRLGVGYIVVPYRAHEQLMNMEQIVFGELRSFDLPATTQDAQGLPVQRLRYRPEAAQAMAYRLTMEGGRGIPGLRAIAWSREGAATPDGLSGLVYAVEPLTSTDKSQDRP